MSNTYKRPFVWLSRITHRHGYGIHSPFAFNLITEVIYQKTPFYGYADLRQTAQLYRQQKKYDLLCKDESQKLCRLLFRLANDTQPHTLYYIGKESISLAYMKSACHRANPVVMSGDKAAFDNSTESSLAYIRFGLSIEELNHICRQYIDSATPESLLIIHGIGFNKEMKRFWKRLITDKKAGITFDLYDVGLVYFDRSRIKRHYIVNF